MILVVIFTLGLPQFSPGLALVVIGTLFWNMLLPLWRHDAPDAHVSVTPLGVSHAIVAESPHGGVATTASMMDVASVVLLALLTGLNALVWWCSWQRRPRWPRRSWRAWLRGRLRWHLAGLHSAVGAWVWHLHRWAQRRPLRVRIDTRLVPPCVLCGDARHTTQEHVLLPQRELERSGAVPLHELVRDYGYEHAGQRVPLVWRAWLAWPTRMRTASLVDWITLHLRGAMASSMNSFQASCHAPRPVLSLLSAPHATHA